MPMEWASRLLNWLLKTWHERAIVLKALSFAIVGVVNSAVDFGVFSFAYYYLGLPIIAANVASWAVAVSGSYVMNSMTTFAVCPAIPVDCTRTDTGNSSFANATSDAKMLETIMSFGEVMPTPYA